MQIADVTPQDVLTRYESVRDVVLASLKEDVVPAFRLSVEVEKTIVRDHPPIEVAAPCWAAFTRDLLVADADLAGILFQTLIYEIFGNRSWWRADYRRAELHTPYMRSFNDLLRGNWDYQEANTLATATWGRYPYRQWQEGALTLAGQRGILEYPRSA